MLNSEIRKVKYGNNVRYTFGKVKEVSEIPYLLEIQKNSYKKFIWKIYKRKNWKNRYLHR